MIITFLAPELIVGKACSDAWSAWKHGKLLHRLAQADGIPWSATHSFFADMGGFAFKFDNETEQSSEAANFDQNQEIKGMTSNDGQMHPSSAAAQEITVNTTDGPQDVQNNPQMMPDDSNTQAIDAPLHSHTISPSATQGHTTVGERGIREDSRQFRSGNSQYEGHEENIQNINRQQSLQFIFDDFPGSAMAKLERYGRMHWK